MPAFVPIQWLTVFILGVLLFNWAVVRLLYPVGLFAVIDGYMKLWIGALLIYVFFAMNGSAILLAFAINAAISAGTQLAMVYWSARNPPAH